MSPVLNYLLTAASLRCERATNAGVRHEILSSSAFVLTDVLRFPAILHLKRLPVAHTPNVDVHEVRAAIVSHSSALKAQGCVA